MLNFHRFQPFFLYFIIYPYIRNKIVPVHAMKLYREMKLQVHILLSSALGRGAWSGSRPSSFIPGEHLEHSLSRMLCRSRNSLDVLEQRKWKNYFSGVQPVA
jgi:hypothetical protein